MIKHLYFPHDGNAMNDEKLLMLRARCKAEGYGVFWMILESMFMASNGCINRVAIGGLCLGYGVPEERLKEIIDYCVSIGLFKESQEGAISSARMDSHLATLQSLRDAGRRGAEKRWKTSEKNSHPNANKTKQKEIKENKTIPYVVRPETETLYNSIEEMCVKYQLEFNVSKKSLDIIVERYVGKIHMKVEAQHCIAWLIGKNLRAVNTQRIANWFKKSQEIQKRNQLKQLEWKEAKNNPAFALQKKAQGDYESECEQVIE